MSDSAEAVRPFTYEDYVTWPEGERWELLGGEAHAMTPAPSTRHQRVSGRLHALLDAALRGHRCVPFMAPTDVVLSDVDVVQPDVAVVCDPEKVKDDCLLGAPDLVVEVLSPSSALRDRREKKQLYERSGVREYLLVDPAAQCVERFLLGEDNKYGKAEVFGSAETLRLQSLGGLEILLADLFEVSMPPSPHGRPPPSPEA